MMLAAETGDLRHTDNSVRLHSVFFGFCVVALCLFYNFLLLMYR